jgi:hypothetical protein
MFIPWQTYFVATFLEIPARRPVDLFRLPALPAMALLVVLNNPPLIHFLFPKAAPVPIDFSISSSMARAVNDKFETEINWEVSKRVEDNYGCSAEILGTDEANHAEARSFVQLGDVNEKQQTFKTTITQVKLSDPSARLICTGPIGSSYISQWFSFDIDYK